jgi:hypothetical protein
MKNEARIESFSGERGAISIKALVMLVVVLVAGFSVLKFAPVYLEERSLTYEIDELANKVAVRNAKKEDVDREIKRISEEYELPEGAISYETSKDKAEFSLSYNRNIDLLVTQYDWKVDHTVNGKAF